MEKSILIRGPSEKESNHNVQSYTYGHEWGESVEYLDPDNDAVYSYYRTNGPPDYKITGEFDTPWDTQLYIPQGILLAPRDDPGQTMTYGRKPSYVRIIANKGAWPHITEEERTWIQSHLSEVTDEFLCPVFWGLDFVYFLYRDPSLYGTVCNPGGYFTIRTQEEIETHQMIDAPWNAVNIETMTISGTLISGSTTLSITMPWVDTGGLTGFYMDTSFLNTGGYFFLGPNAQGESGSARLISIIDSENVEITPTPYTFQHGDAILYKDSSIEKGYDFHVPEGSGAHILGGGEYTTSSGGHSTETLIELRGGLETFTIIETFIPIPWAIPAPYSIRNVPFTNIWQRFQNPSVPLNWDTLIYKVNGLDITPDVELTLIPGGAELFYDPPTDFPLASKVYIDIYVSASPSILRTFADNVIVGTEYVNIADGDASIIQPGGFVFLGPNNLGQSESKEVRGVVNDTQILIYATEYEYSAGDEILYTYDDYPLSIKYWFDIVDDFKPPTIYNMYPSQGMVNIDVNHWIRFEIRDEGLGVDISSLTFTVNNLVVIPTIYKYSDYWYQVIYEPPVPYYYNAPIECFATVTDLSSQRNRAFAVWSFNTGPSVTPIIMNPVPGYCAFPVHANADVKLDVFAREGGANWPSMTFTIDQKKYEYYSYPKIYRFK